MLPSGRTTPPWEVPVWTLILLIPWGPCRVLTPSVAAHEDAQLPGVLFLLPTSPISPPTETSTPGLGLADVGRDVSGEVKLLRCCSFTVGWVRSTTVEESTSMLEVALDRVAVSFTEGLVSRSRFFYADLEVIALKEQGAHATLLDRRRRDGTAYSAGCISV